MFLDVCSMSQNSYLCCDIEVDNFLYMWAFGPYNSPNHSKINFLMWFIQNLIFSISRHVQGKWRNWLKSGTDTRTDHKLTEFTALYHAVTQCTVHFQCKSYFTLNPVLFDKISTMAATTRLLTTLKSEQCIACNSVRRCIFNDTATSAADCSKSGTKPIHPKTQRVIWYNALTIPNRILKETNRQLDVQINICDVFTASGRSIDHGRKEHSVECLVLMQHFFILDTIHHNI